jgi:hypothetical protein
MAAPWQANLDLIAADPNGFVNKGALQFGTSTAAWRLAAKISGIESLAAAARGAPGSHDNSPIHLAWAELTTAIQAHSVLLDIGREASLTPGLLRFSGSTIDAVKDAQVASPTAADNLALMQAFDDFRSEATKLANTYGINPSIFMQACGTYMVNNLARRVQRDVGGNGIIPRVRMTSSLPIIQQLMGTASPPYASYEPRPRRSGMAMRRSRRRRSYRRW